MMNREALIGIITLFCTIAFQKAICQNTQFRFTGQIAGQQKGMVYLVYVDNNGKRVDDSCSLNEGRFIFRGRMSEPTMAILKEGDKKEGAGVNGNSTEFWLTPGNSQAFVQKGHFTDIRVTGSKSQQEYEYLQRQMQPVLEQSSSMENDFLKTNRLYIKARRNHERGDLDSLAARLEVIRSQLEPSGRELSQITRRFIVRHPDSYVSAFELYIYKSRWAFDSVRSLYDQLSVAMRQGSYGKRVEDMVGSIEGNTAGKIAHNFTAKGIDGNPVRLSDLKGKYVLLDFWASWCVPCRKGNPHLMRLFRKYHSSGLDVISISEDADVRSWKKAVKEDGLDAWDNILNGEEVSEGKSNDARSIDKMYGVQVLPTRILIDEGGKIIGRYTGEPEPALDEKLKDVFRSSPKQGDLSQLRN